LNILVIGGTRYMGRIAVQLLLDRGDNVSVFSRGNTQPDWWSRVTHISGDRTDEASFQASLKGKTFDAVLDMQAFRKEHVEQAVETLWGNVGRYLLVSTGSVYLDGKLDFSTHCPFKESDVDWTDLDYTYPEGEDPYGVGKRHCEKWLHENSDVPYTIVRIPAVMGWDDPTSRMWWWVQRALDGKGAVLPLEDQAPFRTLYCGDAAANFIRAIESPKTENQTYHISMQEIMTPNRWVDLIWRAAGSEPEITYVPREILQATLSGSASGDGGEYFPPLCRPIPYIQDLTRSVNDFGFETTPVASWIQTTVDWYREEYRGEDSKRYNLRSEELSLAKRWRESFSGLIEDYRT
jgi:nucleoside-diphosphate-sugar epimerase